MKRHLFHNKWVSAIATAISFFSNYQNSSFTRLMRYECSLTMLHAKATQIIVMEKWESLWIKSDHFRPDYSLVIPILSVKKHKYIVKFISLFFLMRKWSVHVKKGHSVQMYSTLWVDLWATQKWHGLHQRIRTQNLPCHLPPWKPAEINSNSRPQRSKNYFVRSKACLRQVLI